MAASDADRKRMAALAITVVAKILADRGIDDSEIMDMDQEELTAFLEDHGVDLDIEAMVREVTAQLEPDRAAIESGLTDSAKREQVQAKVDKLLVETARNVARETVRSAQLTVWRETDTRDWDEQLYVWISVGDERICDSCHSLHGQIFAIDQWEDVGLPGSGNTICGKRCRCTLLPTGGTDRDAVKRRDASRRDGLPQR